jgi:hypothetical protein
LQIPDFISQPLTVDQDRRLDLSRSDASGDLRHFHEHMAAAFRDGGPFGKLQRTGKIGT